MTDHAYDIVPEMLIVEEFDSVYIIPPMQAPIRLNLSGSLIWRIAASASSTSDVIAEYARYYECAPDEVNSEVISFLDDMIQRGFLRVKEDSTS